MEYAETLGSNYETGLRPQVVDTRHFISYHDSTYRVQHDRNRSIKTVTMRALAVRGLFTSPKAYAEKHGHGYKVEYRRTYYGSQGTWRMLSDFAWDLLTDAGHGPKHGGRPKPGIELPLFPQGAVMQHVHNGMLFIVEKYAWSHKEGTKIYTLRGLVCEALTMSETSLLHTGVWARLTNDSVEAIKGGNLVTHLHGR